MGLWDGFVAKITDAGASSSFNWVKPFGGAGNDEARTVAVSGTSIYVGGRFENTANFGSASTTSTGGYDGFIAKLEDAGNSGDFAWVKSVGGASNGDILALSSTGTAVYAASNFTGQATFDASSLSSAGGIDGFVTKLLDGGTTSSFAWAKSVGGTGNDYITALAPAAGGTYAVGSFVGTVGFGPTSLTSAGGNDAFVTRFADINNNGSIVWVQQVQGVDEE
jgi:hypothetical protein